MRLALHLLIVAALTLLTQLGGIAWLVALGARWRLATFAAAYLALSAGAIWVAPAFGRVHLGCGGSGSPRAASPVFCVLNRSYATPEMAKVLDDLSRAMAERHPGTQVLLLDANFPFLDGFPLLPHLSHDDGGRYRAALP